MHALHAGLARSPTARHDLTAVAAAALPAAPPDGRGPLPRGRGLFERPLCVGPLDGALAPPGVARGLLRGHCTAWRAGRCWAGSTPTLYPFARIAMVAGGSGKTAAALAWRFHPRDPFGGRRSAVPSARPGPYGGGGAERLPPPCHRRRIPPVEQPQSSRTERVDRAARKYDLVPRAANNWASRRPCTTEVSRRRQHRQVAPLQLTCPSAASARRPFLRHPAQPAPSCAGCWQGPHILIALVGNGFKFRCERRARARSRMRHRVHARVSSPCTCARRPRAL